MPRSPLHESLEPLEGRWAGDGEVLPNPWGPSGPTTGEWSFRFDRNRLNLIHDYAEERAGGAKFEGHGVLTVDPAADTLLWFWFDSYGFPPVPPSVGCWEGQRLILEKTTPRGVGRSIFGVTPEALDYVTETRLNGESDFTRIAVGRYRRL